MSNYEEIQNALSYIDSRDRETWFEVGAALKDELGDDGFNLWDNWSQSAENYKTQDAKAVWKSIKPGHIHIASLFHHARTGGYRPSKPYVPPTAEEQAKRTAAAQARQQAEEKARIEKQAAVKSNAQKIWSRAQAATLNHPYLVAKGITAAAAISGLRQNPYKNDLNLLVPVVYEREIVNLQSINQDGGKRFLAGGQVKGGYAVVGDAAKTENGIVIAEGYATAASIHQATGKPVLVAFNAGNMVTVSERLAKTLPPNVPVTIAVDNDASQTGIKKAAEAAAHFGDRARAIQPEFTMTQIQQYQREKGLDSDGNPQLPSDFNDLHHLAGIDAVKSALAVSFRRPEATATLADELAALKLPDDVRIQTDVLDSGREIARVSLQGYDNEVMLDKLDTGAHQSSDGGYLAQFENSSMELSHLPTLMAEMTARLRAAHMRDTAPPTNAQALSQAAETAASLQPEPTMSEQNLHNAAVASEAQNSIEFDDSRQRDITAEAVHYESDFKDYRIYDPTTDIQYIRKTPSEIQADLDKAGGIHGYDGVKHNGETVGFKKTDGGKWEAPQAGERPQPAELSDGLKQVAEAKPKPVLDLSYKIPPDSIKSRYIVADGQYLSAQNGTTVLFEDKGKSISTAKTDTQTINDMLEVAKAKGWDSIKLNGTKEFKQMMYVAAESQGIRTKGYAPTAADLALVEHLRQDKALNSIEAAPAYRPDIETPLQPPEQAVQTASSGGERIVAHGAAPYRNDPQQQESYYLTLEKDGKERTVWGIGLPDALEKSGAQVGDTVDLHSLGKQPVQIQAPVFDQDGKVVGHETKGTNRNVFEIDVLNRNQTAEPEQQPENKQDDRQIRTKPDVAAISAADKMMAQGNLPSEAQINVSERADTDKNVPIHAIGGEEIHSEVKHHADELKAHALDTGLVSAKQTYMQKAEKLSKPNRERLAFYERTTLDAIRGAREDVRTDALRNYYEHTAKQMQGSKLDLPQPVQIPVQGHSTALPRPEQSQSQQPSRGMEEPEYGR